MSGTELKSYIWGYSGGEKELIINVSKLHSRTLSEENGGLQFLQVADQERLGSYAFHSNTYASDVAFKLKYYTVLM